ncbi:ribose 5-phosphate isomerase B [Paenibacillus periandrae]|uniref:ribose 5-phosphate isomerase B n=1 Tax=Paenibacillus periandrae TaxID=1761741 RepID=UPI001F088D40|nr:ribose 5-phosphate isomerase B [Paenibacillus periandrae]
MKLVIGSDHAGVQLKDGIIKLVQSLGHEVTDVGCHSTDSVDYSDYAIEVCNKVAAGTADRGILLCGTGIGMTIAANKIAGIRCALVHDLFSAQMTRQHNDSNVLAMGERIVGPGLAESIVKVWLETEFSNGERHVNRIQKVMELEDKVTPQS